MHSSSEIIHKPFAHKAYSLTHNFPQIHPIHFSSKAFTNNTSRVSGYSWHKHWTWSLSLWTKKAHQTSATHNCTYLTKTKSLRDAMLMKRRTECPLERERRWRKTRDSAQTPFLVRHNAQ